MATRNILRIVSTRTVSGLPLEANAVINPGEIVLRHTTTGNCRAGAAGLGASYVAVGVHAGSTTVDNTGGAAGAKTVDVWQGVFLFDNSATNTITATKLTATCYCEDGNTVGTSNANSAVGPAIGLGYSSIPGVQVKIES